MAAWRGGFEGGLAHGVPAANIEEFKEWLQEQIQFPGLRLIAFHNSWRPDMAMTDATPGGYDQRQRNIAVGYKRNGWRGGPAFNVYPDGTIRGGTPWGFYGVHTPSWNDFGIGIEGMADFDHDDDDAGRGLVIKNTICEMIAAILRHQNLPVTDITVKLHRDDPHTTHHGCPGHDIEKADILARVMTYYNALGTPGEHDHEVEIPDALEPMKSDPKSYSSTVDGLNLRSSGGMNGKIVTTLAKGQVVRVWSTSKNASTVWAHVTGTKDGTSFFDGYVAMAYLKEVTLLSSTPAPGAVTSVPSGPPVAVETKPLPVPIPIPTDRPHWAMQILHGDGVNWPEIWAAGAIGNAQVESYKDLRVGAEGDHIGGKATAFTIWQLRDDRHENFNKFAAARGKPETDFETQVLWAPQELRESEHLAWKWLQQATTVEQATAAMALYERPAGYISRAAKAATTWPEIMAVAEKVSHWDWRLANAKARLAAV